MHMPGGTEHNTQRGLPRPRRASTNHRLEVSRLLSDQPLAGDAQVALSDHAPASPNGGPNRNLPFARRQLSCRIVRSVEGAVPLGGLAPTPAQRPSTRHRPPTHQVHGDAVHGPSLVFLTSGIKLRARKSRQDLDAWNHRCLARSEQGSETRPSSSEARQLQWPSWAAPSSIPYQIYRGFRSNLQT